MGRSPCCSKIGLNRGTWTALEDKILTSYIKAHGEGQWKNLPNRAGLKRCGKSCRLRWLNYLKPDIKRGNITADEEELILRLHRLLGNRWSLIAGRLPGRTDNEIKNYWHTILAKKAKPPSLPQTFKAPSMVIKPLPTKARAVKCTEFPFINSNFDLHLDPINYPDLDLPIFQGDHEGVGGTAAYCSSGDDLGFFDFENHGDDPFPACNILLMEDFLRKECMGKGNSGGEEEMQNNSLGMESLDMLLSSKQWP